MDHVENRKTNLPFKLPADVGTSSELRKLFVHRCGLSCDPHGRVTIIRPRVMVVLCPVTCGGQDPGEIEIWIKKEQKKHKLAPHRLASDSASSSQTMASSSSPPLLGLGRILRAVSVAIAMVPSSTTTTTTSLRASASLLGPPSSSSSSSSSSTMSSMSSMSGDASRSPTRRRALRSQYADDGFSHILFVVAIFIFVIAVVIAVAVFVGGCDD